jgi:hypothetical protein
MIASLWAAFAFVAWLVSAVAIGSVLLWLMRDDDGKTEEADSTDDRCCGSAEVQGSGVSDSVS